MAAFSLNLPERRRNYRFALTPLADAMFQLLIFFMLSAGLTPYSLLTLQSAAAQATGEAAQAEGGEAEPLPRTDGFGDVALWTLEAETLLVGGQRFGFEALDELTDALGEAEVVLIIRPSARVQDVTTVLARLNAANITSVQITTQAGL